MLSVGSLWGKSHASVSHRPLLLRLQTISRTSSRYLGGLILGEGSSSGALFSLVPLLVSSRRSTARRVDRRAIASFWTDSVYTGAYGNSQRPSGALARGLPYAVQLQVLDDVADRPTFGHDIYRSPAATAMKRSEVATAPRSHAFRGRVGPVPKLACEWQDPEVREPCNRP